MALIAGNWPDQNKLLQVLVKAAPGTLKTFRADSGEFGSKPWICNDQNVLFWLSVLWKSQDQNSQFHR